ncbi:MAG: NUDIX hydrolase [Candidatus Levybacteria bacterium]|nr:NUDIX hydrolase [Candidatus Levybacteria bacterium]MBP9815110.1 NUDIX hydrolase [Candidatus Levybacteria bacterium]
MITCIFENGNKASLRHAVVDVLVLKDGKILLVKRVKQIIEGGKWSIVGGFVEHDETLLEAAKREVFEETGWEIENLKLLFIQDGPRKNEGNRQSIAFVYTADGVIQTGKHDWEEDKIEWFNLSNLPDQSDIAFDHYDHIQRYLKDQTK